MAIQSSQRLPELQFYMKKSYRILKLQFYKGTHTPYIIQPPYTLHRSREFSIQNPILHAEDKELFEYYYYYYIQRAKRPSFQKRNSMHRGQGDLLEIHPCVTSPYKGIPDIPVFPDIPVIHDLPAYPGNSTSSSISRESTPFQHSPIRMHILHILHILQILQFDWFPQKTPPSTSWTIQTTNILQTLHSSKKGRCCDISQIDIFSRIELFSSNVLSSEKTNYKNDIQ